MAVQLTYKKTMVVALQTYQELFWSRQFVRINIEEPV